MQQEIDLAKKVFKTGSEEKVVSPPDQVFLNPDFEFLFTIGGHLAKNAEQYNKLTDLLTRIGENEFFVVENLGATSPHNDKPFTAKFSMKDSFEQFDATVKKFNPPFGFFANHFYVFGHNKNWGIYISEYPTINIIGCSAELKNKFADIFTIRDNGFAELENFIDKEFHGKKDLKQLLIKNYKIL